ncbi:MULTISPECIES: hypothetical protein [Providencia]|uniref:Helix-turn-helix domain-containing protein n=1 Tax=Providencia hangzhouensis TaxID=3031799 RepID=A0ABY9ZDV6_9GAMM|nr:MULTISPECIES: hypothetical protein [Providencia]MDH2376046.1 hypothetical protein [Providencia rettgeri]PYZ59687.1 hypothetical protein DNK63_11410 [Providencia rettgeri]QLI95505.1 hypothetical protein H0A34_08805 [Providencia rettgeri]WNK25908.1 hypothetical protein PZ638_08580 [Providencia hangzhouensis]
MITEYQYTQGIEVIRIGREFKTINAAILKNVASYSPSAAHRTFEMLEKIGCIKYVGNFPAGKTKQRSKQYSIDPHAITKLKAVWETKLEEKEKPKRAEKLKTQSPSEPKKVDEIKKCEPEPRFECGIKVVEKAYIGDMGNQSLKQLDQLLAGVRP